MNDSNTKQNPAEDSPKRFDIRTLVHMPQSVFGRNILRVLTGSGIAQAIAVICIPVLGWVYKPDELGVFAAFFSLANILTALLGARYELAIPTAADDRQGWQILKTVWVFNGLGVALCAAVLFFYRPDDLNVLGTYVFALPIVVGLNALRASATYWLARLGAFSITARMKVLFAVATLALQLLLAVLVGGSRALVLASVGGALVAVIYGVGHAIRLRPRTPNDATQTESLSWSETLRRYRQFPIYLLPAHTINSLSANLPILFLSKFAGADFTGLVFLAVRAVQVPTSLIGQSIDQVFYPEAARQYKLNGQCHKLFRTIVKRLTLMYCLGLPIVGVAAYLLLPSLLGREKWADVGLVTLLLSVFSIVRSINSPVSSLWMITGHQRQDLIWQISLLVSVFAGLYGGFYWGGGFGAIAGYGLAITWSFGINLYFCNRFSRGK